jgi:hypothetical protein
LKYRVLPTAVRYWGWGQGLRLKSHLNYWKGVDPDKR